MIHWQPGVSLAEVEKQVILLAYRYYGNNKTKTADCLKVSVKTVYNRLLEYGVKDGEDPDDAHAETGSTMEPSQKMAQESSVPVRKRGKV